MSIANMGTHAPKNAQLMWQNHWNDMVECLEHTMTNRCRHKCHCLIGPGCDGNTCISRKNSEGTVEHPRGKCVRPPFHAGEPLCANCQAHILHRVSQGLARRDKQILIDEPHDERACTKLSNRVMPLPVATITTGVRGSSGSAKAEFVCTITANASLRAASDLIITQI